MSTPLAHLDGGPAPAPDLDVLAPVLARAAARYSEAPPRAGVIRILDADGSVGELTYPTLLATSARVLAGLRRADVRPGDQVLLGTEDVRHLLVGFWACVLGGFVAAPVRASDLPGRPPGMIGTGRPDRPRWLASFADLAAQPPDHDWFTARPHDTVLVTRTAGTTGAPRAVRLSHRAILHRNTATILDNGLDHTAVTVNGMPLDHVGGLVMFHLRDVQLGCTQIHADRSWILADPLRWLDLIDDARASVAWATSSALELIAARVADQPHRSWDLRCLTYLLNGGEPITVAAVRRTATALAPHGLAATAIRPGWGMSETAGGIVDHRLDAFALPAASGPVGSGPAGTGQDAYVPVGRPHPGMSVRIVDPAGRPLPVAVTGRLQVRGPSVAAGYGEDEEHPQPLALRDDGWLDTSDLGRIEGGVLTVTGSTATAMTVAGIVHHSHEIEATVATLPFVDRAQVATCLVTNPVTGAEELAVAYHHDTAFSPAEAALAIRAVLAARHDIHAHHVLTTLPDLPRSRTGKIQRSQLRELVQRMVDGVPLARPATPADPGPARALPSSVPAQQA